MKPVLPIVLGTTIYLVLFTLSPNLGLPAAMLFFFLFIGVCLTLYMVYAVLKYGDPPERKFDDGYWYSDIDKRYSPDA